MSELGGMSGMESTDEQKKEIISMSDAELQLWVERVSEQYFGRPFRHKAVFNSRLRSTGGRYFTETHHIEISPLQLSAYGIEETEKIIKHELCHYHLHLMRRGYRHRDSDFKILLRQVGGSRHCRAIPLPRKAEPYRYRLHCVNCQQEYFRKRKVDTRKYVCGRCRGKLRQTHIAVRE